MQRRRGSVQVALHAQGNSCGEEQAKTQEHQLAT